MYHFSFAPICMFMQPFFVSYRFGGTGGLLGNDTDSLGSEWSLSERERFDDVMETILIELESVCHDEQHFSIKFFKMDQISTNKGTKTRMNLFQQN